MVSLFVFLAVLCYMYHGWLVCFTGFLLSHVSCLAVCFTDSFSFHVFCHHGQGSSLLICFQDVAFLPSRASFSTTFLQSCARNECLVTTTCLIALVWGKQGHAPCKILSLQLTCFYVS